MKQVSTRRRPTEQDYEDLDRLIQRVDYSLVQEGNDLSFGQEESFGFHYTSQRSADLILAGGLGAHPDHVEDHEFLPWIAMGFLRPSVSISLLREFEAGSRLSAYRRLNTELKKLRYLKVVWFYREPEMGGRTASYNEICLKIPLDAVGDWIGNNSSVAYQFDDQADGYALAWLGRKIPARFVVPCDDDEF